MNPQDIFGNDYSPFCEVDPFNPKNEVEGFISRKGNEFYGALIITKVAGKKVTPQLVMATPKMHYPFFSRADGTRNYQFPSARKILAYEKLDGTNVLAYFYHDANENRFLSYKTRLRPFLASSKFGNFCEMWKEVAALHFPAIRTLMTERQCNLSFELYGSRNPHLLVYPNSLDFALLFGVTSTGNILSPNDLGQHGLPTASLLAHIDKDYVWNYEELQRKIQSELKKQEEGYYSGQEGAVWYLETHDGKCVQYKCKPEEIEAIHFSAGAGGLSKNIVLATCWNAFENMEQPTEEFVCQLLLEEFKPEIIDAKTTLIRECLCFVLSEKQFRDRVLEEYRNLGKSIILEKREVMRALSSKFDRNKMGKVYAIVAAYS